MQYQVMLYMLKVMMGNVSDVNRGHFHLSARMSRPDTTELKKEYTES